MNTPLYANKKFQEKFTHNDANAVKAAITELDGNISNINSLNLWIPKNAVATKAALVTTYTAPAKNWAAMVLADGYVYINDGLGALEENWVNSGQKVFPVDVVEKKYIADKIYSDIHNYLTPGVILSLKPLTDISNKGQLYIQYIELRPNNTLLIQIVDSNSVNIANVYTQNYNGSGIVNLILTDNLKKVFEISVDLSKIYRVGSRSLDLDVPLNMVEIRSSLELFKSKYDSRLLFDTSLWNNSAATIIQKSIIDLVQIDDLSMYNSLFIRYCHYINSNTLLIQICDESLITVAEYYNNSFIGFSDIKEIDLSSPDGRKRFKCLINISDFNTSFMDFGNSIKLSNKCTNGSIDHLSRTPFNNKIFEKYDTSFDYSSIIELDVLSASESIFFKNGVFIPLYFGFFRKKTDGSTIIEIKDGDNNVWAQVNSMNNDDFTKPFTYISDGGLKAVVKITIDFSKIIAPYYQSVLNQQLKINTWKLYDSWKSITRFNVLLHGKNSLFLGDSITEFGYTTLFPKGISDLTGLICKNGGVGGTQMALHSDLDYREFSLYKIVDAIVSNNYTSMTSANSRLILRGDDNTTPLNTIKNYDYTKLDYLIIGFGTNDFGNGTVDIGTMNKDTTTLIGAMSYSIDKLQSHFPNLKIIFWGLLYRHFNTVDSNIYINPFNHKLVDYKNAIKSCAEYYSIPFFDCNNVCINEFNTSQMQVDGTHLSPLGYDKLNNSLGRFIISI